MLDFLVNPSHECLFLSMAAERGTKPGLLAIKMFAHHLTRGPFQE